MLSRRLCQLNELLATDLKMRQTVRNEVDCKVRTPPQCSDTPLTERWLGSPETGGHQPQAHTGTGCRRQALPERERKVVTPRQRQTDGPLCTGDHSYT